MAQATRGLWEAVETAIDWLERHGCYDAPSRRPWPVSPVDAESYYQEVRAYIAKKAIPKDQANRN